MSPSIDGRAHDPKVERERVRRRSDETAAAAAAAVLRPAASKTGRAQKTRSLRHGLKRMPLACSVTRSRRVIRRGMGAIFWLGLDEFAPVCHGERQALF